MSHPVHAHIIQHVPFEGPGRIADWVLSQGGALSWTHLYAGDSLPGNAEDFDLVVIMGGPMGVHDTDQYPWLQDEIKWVRQVLLNTSVRILGVCLGAQIMAHALGAAVRRNPVREIGWYPVRRFFEQTSNVLAQRLARGWPREFMAFHWHGETFDIPDQAVILGSSEACANQGFVWGDRAIGLQFHLESHAESVDDLLRHCPDDLADSGPWVADAEEIRRQTLLYQEQSAVHLAVCLNALMA